MITSFLFIVASCTGIFLLMTVVFIRRCLVVITVKYQSMSPTLEHNDRILVVRNWPKAWLRKGHIVIVWPQRTLITKSTLFEETLYIKRIIALGGETVTATVSPIDETDDMSQYETFNQQSQQVWYIPEKYIFVRGDNRAGSIDSFVWGPIPMQSVLGIAIMKLPRKTKPSSLNFQ